jgi:aminoglycoside phosphotransferase (APT) family kinase protein
VSAEPRPELPGLPRSRVDDWLRRELPGLHQDLTWHAEIISGGLSNITYRLVLAGGTVVLRRPPLGHVLPRAHDMRREHRVLAALASAGYPAPAPLALCIDSAVLGADFYVMAEVPGVVLRDPEATDPLLPEERRRLSRELVETLAQLHELEPDEIGLGDYGRRGGYAQRQVRTWAAQWERSRTRDLPDMDRLIARLSERVPGDERSSVVHGDYRLDNTIVDTAAGTIKAVLDWELSTLGDPVADLALMMTYWHDEGDADSAAVPVAVGITAKPGFLRAAELADLYAARTGADLAHLDAQLALAAMKLAVILEGVHARYLGGQTVGGGYELAGAAVPALVARALRLLPTA